MSNSQRSRSIDGVAAVLGKIFQQRGMEDKLRRGRVWQLWDRVVGPQIAARARPARFRDNTLEVWVDHAVWMQQLQLMKPQILGRLNAAIGEDLIRDIFLRRSSSRQQNAPAATVEPAAINWRQAQLSDAEEERITQTVASLSDPELRRNLRRLLHKQAQLNKAREKKEQE